MSFQFDPPQGYVAKLRDEQGGLKAIGIVDEHDQLTLAIEGLPTALVTAAEIIACVLELAGKQGDVSVLSAALLSVDEFARVLGGSSAPLENQQTG